MSGLSPCGITKIQEIESGVRTLKDEQETTWYFDKGDPVESLVKTLDKAGFKEIALPRQAILTGTVSAVQIEAGTPKVIVGGNSFDLSQVLMISPAPSETQP